VTDVPVGGGSSSPTSPNPTIGLSEAATVRRSGSFLVAAGIFLSSTFGLIREISISAFLGVGATADVFKAAVRIPNLIQNLLGEGSLSASFIPVYSKLLEEDEEQADALAGNILGLLLAVMTGAVVVGIALARPLTDLLTPGFTGAQLDLATTLLRIAFPAIALSVLSAYCTGVLNSHRRFFLSYASPVMWNLGQIGFLSAAAIYGATDVGLAHALTLGLLFGAFSEVLIQVRDVKRLMGGARLSVSTRSPHTRSVLRRFVPVIAGRGVIQLVNYIELVLASLLAVGGVSALTYSQLLYMLPISLFGMAVAAAELPELARLGQAGHHVIRQRLGFGLDRIAFYVAFTAAIYIFAGDVVVGALLQRSSFSPADTRLVWLTVAAFSLGLLGTTRSRLLQNALYALDESRTVARLAVFRAALAAGLGALLMFPLDRWMVDGTRLVRNGDLGFGPLPDHLRLVDHGTPHLGIVGLALGAAISSWVEFRLLRRALRGRIGEVPRMTVHGRWCIIAGFSSGILAAGLRTATEGLPRLLAAPAVVAPAGLMYLAITGVVAVPEAKALVDGGVGLVRRRRLR
jgi:putative peptidoglycan lipid II flippase